MNKNIGIKMRMIHRYLGFFLAGIMAMYALSGIVLIFRTGDTFKNEIKKEINIGANVSQDQLGQKLEIRGLKVDKIENNIFYFKNGEYNGTTGIAKYSKMELPYILDKMTHLHKADTKQPLFFLNIFFGLSLLFFVISSFWMFMPSSSTFKKGMYFTFGGIVLVLVLLFV